VPAASVSPAVQAIADKMRGIQSLQVRMRQTKTLSVLAETVTSDGTLTFVRPRRLVIDLAGEAGTTLIIDGDAMTTVFKALGATERTSLSKDPRGRVVAEHLFLLLDLEPKALAAVHEVAVLSEKPLKIRLTPRPETLARILNKIEARFDVLGFVDELTIFERNGDQTRWQFDSARVNQAIPESVFRPRPESSPARK
jgi:outer membrane lipoprotein-sorting protein